MENQVKPLILIVEDVESNYLYLNAVLSKLAARVEWVKNGLLIYASFLKSLKE